MADLQEPMLVREVVSDDHQPLRKLKRFQWWKLVILSVLFIIVGQTAATLLGRYYYDKGGSSKWMVSLLQTAGFPILFIPYFFLQPADDAPGLSSQPSVLVLGMIYCIAGALFAIDCLLYSFSLLYLSASTYSLICATQVAFNAIFSFFINRQKFTALILNSVVVLSLSAALLAVNEDTDQPSGVSNKMYIIGILAALGASALYSLVLSLTQLAFEKIIKKESFTAVLDMLIFPTIVATCVSIAGLFISGEWQDLPREMHGFSGGEVSYVMTLASTAVAWQLNTLGMTSLIYYVSSLFSNVVNTLSLAITPLAALIIFHDKMNGVKIVAMLMAFWGFTSYVYQSCCDERNEARRKSPNSNDLGGI